MNPETRAVVDAVREALDIPHAATAGGDETRQEILTERVMHLLVCVTYLSERYRLAEKVGLPIGSAVPDQLAYLRERLATHPPAGYVTNEQARERRQQGASWMESVALPDENAGG